MKVKVDKNLKKYIGADPSEKKAEVFNESIEQIKIALSKHSKQQVNWYSQTD